MTAEDFANELVNVIAARVLTKGYSTEAANDALDAGLRELWAIAEAARTDAANEAARSYQASPRLRKAIAALDAKLKEHKDGITC